MIFSNKSVVFTVSLLPVSIDSIREVCEGKQSEIFQRYSDVSFDPNCCFSIYYGDHMQSLDLVSSSGEEARTWITGLKYLVAGISDEDSLAKRQRTRDQYPFLYPLFILHWNMLGCSSGAMQCTPKCVGVCLSSIQGCILQYFMDGWKYIVYV